MRLLAALTVLTVAAAVGFAGTSFGSSSSQHGDIDCDGDRDAVDALRILQDVAGLKDVPVGCGAGLPDPTSTPAPGGPATSFGDGIYFVGSEIAPGTYRNSDSSNGCSWKRLAGFSGEFGDLIAIDLTFSLTIVTIEPTDVGFSTDDCGTWTKISTPTPDPGGPATVFGDGIYFVGIEIAPGTYRNSDSSDGCSWQRLAGFSGEFGDLIAIDLTFSLTIVTIEASDVGFSTRDCGTWTKV